MLHHLPLVLGRVYGRRHDQRAVLPEFGGRESVLDVVAITTKHHVKRTMRFREPLCEAKVRREHRRNRATSLIEEKQQGEVGTRSLQIFKKVPLLQHETVVAGGSIPASQPQQRFGDRYPDLINHKAATGSGRFSSKRLHPPVEVPPLRHGVLEQLPHVAGVDHSGRRSAMNRGR